jgi:hypothetical protein
MRHWMRTRALRTAGLLFGLSMMLMACGDVGDLPGAIGGGQPPASEESEPDDVTDESEPDDVSDESEPGDVSDESEPDEDGHDEDDCRNRNHRHGQGGDDSEEADEAEAEQAA